MVDQASFRQPSETKAFFVEPAVWKKCKDMPSMRQVSVHEYIVSYITALRLDF